MAAKKDKIFTLLCNYLKSIYSCFMASFQVENENKKYYKLNISVKCKNSSLSILLGNLNDNISNCDT